MLIKADGSLSVWEGVEEISERLWVIYEDGEEKHAFCGVYLAVKPYKNKKSEEQNAEILNLLQIELAKLTAQNYSVSLCGDFNSWLGTTGPYGMRENRNHINPNGELLIGFMTPRNIKLANKFEQAKGVFTRFQDRKDSQLLF